jgi:MFS family permease
MATLALVLLAREAGGSYAAAGALASGYALGVAVSGPAVGWAIDRFGQTRLLVPTAIGFATLLSLLVLLVTGSGPGPEAVVLAALAGASYPPIGSSMRALWPQLVDGEPARNAAYALDAVIQEISFLLGPLLVGAFAATVAPSAAVLAAAAFGAGGALAFATCEPSRRAPRRPGATRGSGALRGATGIVTIMAATVAIGFATSAVAVAMPAFAETHGERAAAGILLSCLSVGSFVGGVVAGLLTSQFRPARRYLASLALFAVGLIPLLLAGSIAELALLALVTGLPLAPSFASAYALLGVLAREGTATATFAWNSSSVIAGSALGSAVGGVCVSAGGYRLAILAAIGAATVAVGTVATRRAGLQATVLLSPAPADA